MSKRTLLLACAILAAASPGVTLSAWGNLGHQMAATGSLADLPPDLGAWFEGREGALKDHANDPDDWKHHDPLEGPKHFLDCEAYGGAASVPVDEDAAKARVGADLFQKEGQVPWTILARVDSLSRTFATGDADQVAFEAAILSHYVADLSVPLHTTSNHDGAETGQHGIHRRWESTLLQRIVNQEDWLPEVRAAVPTAEPAKAPWAWLQEGYSLVPQVLADDSAAERAGQEVADGLGTVYWKVFQRLEGPIVKEQLTLAANRTAQMILWAWTRAGKPAAPVSSAR